MKIQLGDKTYPFNAATIQRIISSTDAQSASKIIYNFVFEKLQTKRELVTFYQEQLNDSRKTVVNLEDKIENLQYELKEIGELD